MKFDTKKKIILGVCIGLTLVVLIMIGAMLAALFHKKPEAETAEVVEEVQEEEVVEEEPEVVEEPEEEEPEEIVNDIDFASLKSKVTEDVVSWLYVPGTAVSYPVLRPGAGKDTDYYVRKDYKGNYFTGGSLYMQQCNKADFTDRDTIVYGHNMNNGTMFRTLHNYEDASFFKSHPYVYMFTPSKTLIYQVFCAYRDDDKLLLDHYGYFKSFDTFKSYLEDSMSSAKAYQTNKDVKITSSDRVLSLCTCIRYDEHGRYYLLCRQLTSEEAAKVDKDAIKQAYDASVSDVAELLSKY